jgi:hypothetical protein
MMEGQAGIPVQPSEHTQGPKRSGLNEGVVPNLKLQPGFARQFHFSIEEQAFFGFVGNENPPKIQRVPGFDVRWASAAPAQANPTHQLVNEATQFP